MATYLGLSLCQCVFTKLLSVFSVDFHQSDALISTYVLNELENPDADVLASESSGPSSLKCLFV